MAFSKVRATNGELLEGGGLIVLKRWSSCGDRAVVAAVGEATG